MIFILALVAVVLGAIDVYRPELFLHLRNDKLNANGYEPSDFAIASARVGGAFMMVAGVVVFILALVYG